MLRVVFCDSDQAHVEKWSSYLDEVTEIEFEKKVFSSFEAMLFSLDANLNDADLIFMECANINSKKSGIDVAKQLRSKNFFGEIIFFSDDKRRVFQAFDVDAMHYLIKGDTTEEKVRQQLIKAHDRMDDKQYEIVVFSCAGENRVVKVRDIKYFEVKNKIVTVYYADTSFEFYSTLEKIENILSGRQFVRTHKSYLVALKEIKTLNYGAIMLTNGSQLPVGRKYQQKVKSLFPGFNTDFLDQDELLGNMTA